MKILEKEIGLREETRAAEQSRPALTPDVYADRAKPLADAQEELRGRVAEVTTKIEALPDGMAKFEREIALLSRVEVVMREAHGLLATPDTGPPTIAAETEAIELLLQARRANPKGGGGGGASPGGGGTGTTDEAALALIGAGSERQAHTVARDVRQATGVSGGQFPAEFSAGLDAYFGALESARANEGQ